MSLQTGLTTGLLAYSLRKEFLGESLFYRETEIFEYEVYAIPQFNATGFNFTTCENIIKQAFSGYSGEVTVKSLSSPAEYSFPNDHLRAGKFNVQVELRRNPTNITGIQSELNGVYYSGLGGEFFTNYAVILDSFNEDFSFEDQENGNKAYAHNFSFVLRTGGKQKAVEIASGLFNNDKDTTFGISAMIGGVTGANTGTFQNYYNESYDLIKNSFSFTKKREFLPFTASSYLYNLVHSLNVQENGIIEVNEKGEIQGKINFNNALLGYDALKAGSYLRCSGIYASYKNIGAGEIVSGTLANMAISSSRALVKPSLSITYDVKYSDDPNLDPTNQVSIEKILDVDYSEGKFVDITHTYNFVSFVNPVYDGMEDDFIGILNTYQTQSPTEIQNYYVSSPFYNSTWPTQNAVRFSSNLGNRRKTFGFSYSYTNNPIYLFTLDGYEYKFFDYKISDTKPPDILTEYKIINRTTKNSLINYAYQTDRGTKTISITTRLSRPPNVFLAPIDVSARVLSLYRFGVQKIMSTFFGLSTLALTYHLSDLKYFFDSENELNVSLSINYTIKKHTA